MASNDMKGKKEGVGKKRLSLEKAIGHEIDKRTDELIRINAFADEFHLMAISTGQGHQLNNRLSIHRAAIACNSETRLEPGGNLHEFANRPRVKPGAVCNLHFLSQLMGVPYSG